MEGGELVFMTMLRGHETKDLGSLQEKVACFTGSTGKQACVSRFTQPRAAGNELGKFGGARMIEKRHQFLGPGVEEGLQGKAGEKFAVVLKELLEVGNGIRLLQSGRPQAEFHHAFNFAKDVVLPKHGSVSRVDLMNREAVSPLS